MNILFVLHFILIFTYRYLHLPIKEVSGPIIESSSARHKLFDRLGKPKTIKDVINILGDESEPVHSVFRTGDKKIVQTICVG